MFKVSLHNHTNLSDGKDTMKTMVEAAIEKGFTHFGITDHVSTYDYEEHSLIPEKYDEYVDMILEFQDTYKDKIEIFAGMETERYGDSGYLMSDVSKIRNRLDYIVGSIHVASKNGIINAVDEGSDVIDKALKETYDNDPRKLVENYFENYMGNINDLKPEVAGHIDLIKKNNADYRYFDETSRWYLDLVSDTLDVIKKNDAVMELNTGGGYKHGLRCIYPTENILKMAKEKGIKFTMSSDAHNTEMIDCLYEKGIERYKAAGINKLYTYSLKEEGFIPFEI